MVSTPSLVVCDNVGFLPRLCTTRRTLTARSFVPVMVTLPAPTSSTTLLSSSFTPKRSTLVLAHALSPRTTGTATRTVNHVRRERLTPQASHPWWPYCSHRLLIATAACL